MTRGLVCIALLAACGDRDPCDGKTTCVTVDVASSTVAKIDQLELDISYADFHATTTTSAGEHTTGLPLATAIVLDLRAADSIDVGVVAAGKLGGTVLGTGAAQTTLAPSHHATIDIELVAPDDCTAGAFYCGGDKLAGDAMTLYQCNGGGVPIARGVCAGGCLVRPGKDDACQGVGGVCRDGDKYCGGDKLDGDPQSLYICMAGAGITPTRCTNGCLVHPGQNDACQ